MKGAIVRCHRQRKTLLSVNIFDYASFRTLARTFQAAGRPVLAQCSARLFRQYEPAEIVRWRDAVGNGSVWLHLDHCDDPRLLVSCVRAGFDAVMFDGSHLPLALNIRSSRAALKAAKCANPRVLVECEIGQVHGVEDGMGVEEAGSGLVAADVIRFYEAVKPDLLAVGFGNMHGHYLGNEVFDLDLIRDVNRKLPGVPLVLHGGSGMALPLVRKLVAWGHVKLNISTDLKVCWMTALSNAAAGRKGLDSPLAVTHHLKGRMEEFFEKLRKKYRACLL